MDKKLADLLRKLYRLSGQYVSDALPGGVLNPEWTPERTQTALSGLLDVTPVVGDAKSVYEGVQAARQGDMVGAGLGALGALPFIPAMGGVTKQLNKDEFISASVKKLADAMRRHNVQQYEMLGSLDPRKFAAFEKIEGNIKDRLIKDYGVSNVRDASGNKEIENLWAELEALARGQVWGK